MNSFYSPIRGQSLVPGAVHLPILDRLPGNHVYRGTVDGLTVEFQIHFGPSGAARALSGTLRCGREVLGEFLSRSAWLTSFSQTITAHVVFRGSTLLFEGTLRIAFESADVARFAISTGFRGAEQTLLGGPLEVVEMPAPLGLAGRAEPLPGR